MQCVQPSTGAALQHTCIYLQTLCAHLHCSVCVLCISVCMACVLRGSTGHGAGVGTVPCVSVHPVHVEGVCCRFGAPSGAHMHGSAGITQNPSQGRDVCAPLPREASPGLLTPVLGCSWLTTELLFASSEATSRMLLGDSQ